MSQKPCKLATTMAKPIAHGCKRLFKRVVVMRMIGNSGAQTSGVRNLYSCIVHSGVPCSARRAMLLSACLLRSASRSSARAASAALSRYSLVVVAAKAPRPRAAASAFGAAGGDGLLAALPINTAVMFSKKVSTFRKPSWERSHSKVEWVGFKSSR